MEPEVKIDPATGLPVVEGGDAAAVEPAADDAAAV